jgi:hypothetical protein
MQAKIEERKRLFKVKARLSKIAGRESGHACSPMGEEKEAAIAGRLGECEQALGH